jgi:hypothetical protein
VIPISTAKKCFLVTNSQINAVAYSKMNTYVLKIYGIMKGNAAPSTPTGYATEE